MGMFDWYKPAGTLRCPICEVELQGWQGKDGPRGLFVWQEGLKHPIKQELEEELRGEYEDVRTVTLPEDFLIYTDSCRHFMYAIGFCRDDVWYKTELLGSDSVEWPQR